MTLGLAVVALGASLGVATASAQPGPATSQPAPASSLLVEPRGYGLRPEAEPPRYVRPARRTGLPGIEDLDWLDLGVEFRTRVEHHDNDYRRRVPAVDDLLLLRTRLYVGIRQRLDPFRFVVELTDSRRLGGQFAPDDRDVNVTEPIQAYAELHFARGAGAGRPVSVKVGRHAFETLDRRLIARNEWRNTTNTFDGVRATVGRPTGAWQVDLLALKPVRRLLSGLDQPDRAQWLTGAIVDARRWSRVATLQPYYLRLSQDGARAATGLSRDIHTVGVRAYGVAGRTGLDWDVDLAAQRGDDGPRSHRATAAVVEGGYSTAQAWRPRVSVNHTYASGDRNPFDQASERFERLFGFARPFSASDYLQWENLRASKLRIELTPSAVLRVDAGLSGYWLASATDRWNVAGLRDLSGQSGTFMGHEFDVRVRFPIGTRLGVNLGYARFQPGAFTAATSGRTNASHIPYAEVTLHPFR
ncbi:MAG: alginate export family protein [Luteitalea sp.]